MRWPPGLLEATAPSAALPRQAAKAVTTTWPFITAGNCYGTCCQFVIYPALLVAQPSQLFQRIGCTPLPRLWQGSADGSRPSAKRLLAELVSATGIGRK